MENFKRLPQDKRAELIEYTIDMLKEYRDSEIEGSELHHHLFNMDYYFSYHSDATQWLSDRAFDAIGAIQEYEQFNFGEIYTDLSQPQNVGNMFIYIIVGEILNESETLSDNWDRRLSVKMIDKIIKEVKSI